MVSMAAALLATAVLMAVECNPPTPPEPGPPEPPEEISEALKAFLVKKDIGLYIASEGIVIYDELTFQKAWSVGGGSFRIQRDDQGAYMLIRGSSQSSSSYQIEYMNSSHAVTMMLLKLQEVQKKGSCVWLWNETMTIGVIIPEGML